MPIDDESLRQIRRIQNAYATNVKQVQADADLSPQGKGRRLAVLQHRAQTRIAEIRKNADGTAAARRTALERQMFGIHDIPDDISAAISYRDAQDRVAEIKTGAEAQLMMRRAIRSGDGLLARALFDRGWELAGDRLLGSGWGEVVNAYVSQMRPDLADAVNELAALQTADTRGRRFSEQLETSLFTPPELAALNPGDVRDAIAEASVEGLQPGGGTSSEPTARQAWVQAVRESKEGVHGA